MEKIHKDALRKSRTLLVRDITPDAELWDLLLEKGIFTPIMMEYIQAERTKTLKNRKMLDDLVRRGPHAYHKFLECLRQSGHENLADEIQENERRLRSGTNENNGPTIIYSRGSEESVLPVNPPASTASSSIIFSRGSNESVSPVNPSANTASSSFTISASTSSMIPQSLTQARTEPTLQHMQNEASGVQYQPENQLPMDVTDASVVEHEPIIAHPEDNSEPALPYPALERSVYDECPPERKYKMESSPRGYCLIMNNREFVGMDERAGTDQNRDDLKLLFEHLGFIVYCENNLTSEGNLKTLVKEHDYPELGEASFWIVMFFPSGFKISVSTTHNHSMKLCIAGFSDLDGLQDADAVAIVLLSHGNESVIYGSDGEAVNLKQDIFEPFCRKSSRSTLNKPKFFIVNACRGGRHDSGIHNDFIQPRLTVPSNDASGIQSFDVQSSPPSDGPSAPTWRDVYLAYSTFEGYVSYRQDDLGSHFVQHLVETFKTEAHTLDINGLMTQVNSKMASLAGLNQMPSPINMLTKTWYFNPPTHE